MKQYIFELVIFIAWNIMGLGMKHFRRMAGQKRISRQLY